MKVKQAEIDRQLDYHPPRPEDRVKHARLRASAKAFVELIVELTPGSADQNAAVRKVREALWTANAAIACGP